MENKKNIPGMRTCSVCGRDFPLLVENRYTARDNNNKLGFAVFTCGTEDSLYDAIDCPHCGCQNILQLRKRRNAMSELADMVGDDEDEEEDEE